MNMQLGVKNSFRSFSHINSPPVIAYIHSVRGGFYFVQLEQEGVGEWVTTGNGSSLKHFDSIAKAKSFARRCGATQIRLALDTPYDEMIGLATSS